MPFLIMDELFYRLPEIENGCTVNVNVNPLYTWVVDIVNFKLSLVFVVICCPIVLIRKKLARLRRSVHTNVQLAGTSGMLALY